VIKAYPTKWEIVDEAAGSFILKQIEDLFKVGLS